MSQTTADQATGQTTNAATSHLSNAPTLSDERIDDMLSELEILDEVTSAEWDRRRLASVRALLDEEDARVRHETLTVVRKHLVAELAAGGLSSALDIIDHMAQEATDAS